MASNIGMMDSAYFVGRNEILTWINNRLQLNLSRIEEVFYKKNCFFMVLFVFLDLFILPQFKGMFGFPYCFSNFEHVNEMGFLFPI
jgi:hypothetical protein